MDQIAVAQQESPRRSNSFLLLLPTQFFFEFADSLLGGSRLGLQPCLELSHLLQGRIALGLCKLKIGLRFFIRLIKFQMGWNSLAVFVLTDDVAINQSK